ncbi:hypothetical protein BH10BAC2_BH10BAC2_43760 [soil metagenome]
MDSVVYISVGCYFLWTQSFNMGGPLFAVIFAGFIILVLLIVGQLFYNKFPKVCFTIWGLTVLLLFYFIYSFNTANTRFGDKALADYVGTYKIDIYNSSYDSVDLKEYTDLQLIVNANKTFKFSYKTPFFKDTIGHWQHMDDGDISWTELSIGKGSLMQANVETDKWTFTGIELTNTNNSNSIIFTRK